MARQNRQQHIPIYRQFSQTLKAGLQLLDDESQLEIQQFVNSCQHENGGFCDRAGQPDLYYSLFGYWLCSALDFSAQINKLGGYLTNIEEPRNSVDRFSWMLLRMAILKKEEKQGGLLSQFFRFGNQISYSYQFFLFLLVFDARYGRKKWMNLLLRVLLSFYRVPEGTPCSIRAALLIAANEAGIQIKKRQQKLMSYWSAGSGFKAFEHQTGVDMLSTGVSLFALRKSAYDLRLVKSGCLAFIQKNFDRGAFLSGDGDTTRDLEYTFYGLLALGSLTENEFGNGQSTDK